MAEHVVALMLSKARVEPMVARLVGEWVVAPVNVQCPFAWARRLAAARTVVELMAERKQWIWKVEQEVQVHGRPNSEARKARTRHWQRLRFRSCEKAAQGGPARDENLEVWRGAVLRVSS